ncbi:hypothetical protein ACFYRY_17890 [Streptomyces sp. NPDC005263]|uniref:hypothetical protein n=1 Tax=Streptomyces sp. NPDC005263 TaxID=3364711 RepID=UPI0036924BE2
MANTETALKEALSSIEGATGAALVDYTSGMALGTVGGSNNFDLNVAAAGNTDVVRVKLRTMELLGIKDEIEDLLITLGTQSGPNSKSEPAHPVAKPDLPAAQINRACAERASERQSSPADQRFLNVELI